MKTRDAAKGQWARIFDYFGAPRINPKRHYKGECPFCGKKECIRIDDRSGEGDWVSNCRGSGIGFQIVQQLTKKDFRDICEEIDDLLGNHFSPGHDNAQQTQRRAERQSRTDALRDRWRTTQRIAGSQAQDYFRSRGIERLPASNMVAYQPAETGKHAGKQGIWAVAVDSAGRPAYLHRTLLKNGEKVFRQLDRLISEADAEWVGSIHIPLFPVAEVLGVAEGIETALSAHQIYGVNTWATINAGFLAKFLAPNGVKKLMIYADNDENSMAGLDAATTCARRNILNKSNDVEEVVIVYPAEVNDFNDLLNNPGRVNKLPLCKRKKDDRN